MINIVFALLLTVSSPNVEVSTANNVAILPKELELPKLKKVTVKPSKGKGRGRTPYFARYFK